jgi:peptidoglycan hydrolase CwlO-like protein
MAEKKSKEKKEIKDPGSAGKQITLNKDTVDILVTNIIPTTKYFETRFDFLQHQIDTISGRFDEVDRRFQNIERRFDDVDARFQTIERRFDQVDKRIDETNKRIDETNKRFDKVDSRFEGIEMDIKGLSQRVFELTTEVKTSVRDYIIERDRYYDRKFNNLRMFTIALLVGVGGLFLKVIGFFDKLFK